MESPGIRRQTSDIATLRAGLATLGQEPEEHDGEDQQRDLTEEGRAAHADLAWRWRAMSRGLDREEREARDQGLDEPEGGRR